MTDTPSPLPEVKAPSMLPAFLSLFTSTGTLVCCALPALLVTIGAGAVMAGLIEAVPQITWLGKNKELVFSFAALMIAASGLLQWRARSMPCPISDNTENPAATQIDKTVIHTLPLLSLLYRMA